MDKENQIQINTPALRFTLFTEGWEKKTLFELSENGFSNGAFNDPKKVGSGYRIINVKDMYVDGTINIDNLTRVALDKNEFSKNRVEYGDIFFTRSSLVKEGIAHSNVNLNDDDDLTFDGHLIRMRPKKEFYSSIFLYYNFATKNARVQFVQRGKTTTMTTIGQEDISTVEITFPILEEQQKIATFFTAIDAKLSGLKQKRTLLAQYKKGVMQQLFTVDTDGRPYLRFKDTEGGDFEDWEIRKLKDVGEFKNGINKSNEDFGFGFPFINLMDVFGKPTISNLNLGLVNVNEKELIAYELRKGDVLFIRSSVKKSGVGETSLILEDLKDTVYSGFLIRFRDKKIKLDLNFKKYCFSNKKFRESLISLSTTSANTNINQESLNELEISIPCLGEQTKIAHYLSAIDAKIQGVTGQIEKMEMWKKGLLQQMFV